MRHHPLPSGRPTRNRRTFQAARIGLLWSLSAILLLPTLAEAAFFISALRTTDWVYPDQASVGQPSITMQACRNGHDGFQLAITVTNQILRNVQVIIPEDLIGPEGARLPRKNITLYREIPLKITVPTGMHPEDYPEREVFDPLLPLSVDPYNPTETRTTSFDIGRVGATGKSYLAMGDGACFAGGQYTGQKTKHYVIEIESPGDVGEATFRWSDQWNGKMGNNPYRNYSSEPRISQWNRSGLRTGKSPISLNDGITATFSGGGIIYNKKHINYKKASEYRFQKGDRFYFTAYKAQTAAIYGDLAVPQDQAPGVYTGVVEVKGQDNPGTRIPISLTVYDIVIPNKRSVITAFGDRPNVAVYHARDHIKTIQKRYDEALHAHRVDFRGVRNAPSFTFDKQGNLAKMDWRKFDEQMGPMLDGSYWDDGAPMNTFFLSLSILNPGNAYYMAKRSPKEKSVLARAIAAHLKEKGWFDKLIVYCRDEPAPQDFEGIIKDIDIIKRSSPGWDGKFMVTAAPTHDSKLLGHIDIWVPPTHKYDTVNAEGKMDENRFSREDYRREIRGKGHSFWLYVANYPLSGSYMSYQLDRKAIQEPRLLKWASWYEGASGFLYWATIHSGLGVPHPYLNPYFTEQYRRDGKGNGFNGDGMLLYPGDRNGFDGWSRMEGRGLPFPPLDGPLPSIRLKEIRDGLEDWEMFIQAERAGIGEQVRKAMSPVYQAIAVPHAEYVRTGKTSWSRDGNTMWSVRETIARMTEEAIH